LVGDQRANQAAKPLKKGKKEKKNHQFWNNRIAVLVVVMYSFSIQTVCMCLLGRFEALLWWLTGG
jgi:hypothetical protein